MKPLFIAAWKRILLLSAVAVLVYGGAPGAAEKKTPDEYKIHPSDVLEISIYGELDLLRKLIVRPDGYVSFPLIGDILVAGRSTREIKEIIDEKIRAYIPVASSTVIVEQLGSLRYFVLGQVARPGAFNVSTPLTVVQALSLAGGLTTFADQDDILIIRGSGARTQKIPFDYSAVKKGRNLDQNIMLERDDVVLVP